MALDATKPDSTTFLSEFSGYHRETREYVNNITATSGTDVTTLSSDSTTLAVGTELSAAQVETVIFSGSANLTTITGGSAGQRKLFICQADTLDFIHNASGTTGGVIRLNDFSSLDAKTGDVIEFTNIGGDGGVNYGYWVETFRNIKAV